MLVHNANFLNCRLILLIAGPLWEEQGYLSKHIESTSDTMMRMCSLALGAGTAYLVRLFQHATGDAEELARVGLGVAHGSKAQDFAPEADGPMWAPGVLPGQIPLRLMSLLLRTMEARFWSCAFNEECVPAFLAGLCSPSSDERQKIYARAKLLWETSTLYESSTRHPGMNALRNELYWLSWPSNQWRLRLLAHFHFADHEVHLQYWHRLFRRVGDTKIIEDSHKIVRTGVANLCSHQVFLGRSIHFGHVICGCFQDVPRYNRLS